MRVAHASTAELGARAEELACRHLRDRGLRVLTRNYRCRHGEIDLVMEDGLRIVFVEVRLRRRPDFGSGADSVGRVKQRRILASAEHYLQRHATLDASCRFDVVSIDRHGDGHRLRWIRAAFGAD